MKLINNRWNRQLLVLVVLGALFACSASLISDQDPKSLNMMEEVAENVDYMYTKMSYMPANERNYHKFSDYYLDVEVKLNALKIRQEMRVMNELTLKQVDIVVQLWRQDRIKHQTKNTLSDFLLKRHKQQYQRLFTALIKAESAKPQSKQ